MRIVDFFLNLLGWLQIVAGTTAIGLITGGAINYFNNRIGLTIPIILTVIGFITGVIWATRIWIKYGTVEWLSRIRRVK